MSVGELKNSSYHWRLKPEKSWSERVELKENSATTAIGAKLKTMKTQKKMPQPARPVESFPRLPAHTAASCAARAAERR